MHMICENIWRYNWHTFPSLVAILLLGIRKMLYQIFKSVRNYLSLKKQFEFHGVVWLLLGAPSTRYLSWTHHYHVKWKQGYQERWGLSVSSSGCCNIIILQHLTCIWIMGLCEFERAHKTWCVHNVACHAHMFFFFLHTEAWTKWLQLIKNDISEAFL